MMILDPYVGELKASVAQAAALGGEAAGQLAERLMQAVEPALKLSLQHAIADALEQVNSEVSGLSVQAILTGQGIEFAVEQAPVPEDDDLAPEDATTPPAEADEAKMTRLNLRLSQDLKDRIDQAANLDGLSANAWLVKVASRAVHRSERSGEFYARRAFPGERDFRGDRNLAQGPEFRGDFPPRRGPGRGGRGGPTGRSYTGWVD